MHVFMHVPEVECIFKGKVHKKIELDVKESVTTTNRDNFVVGTFVEHGKPFDDHTLSKAIVIWSSG